MITPRFGLTQTENHLTVCVRAPYCNLRDLDLDVEGNTFLFVCRPYYLRLTLPGNLVENDKLKSSYDSDSGEFTFVIEKEYPGENFEDLEMITKFLGTKVDASYNDGTSKIEILTNEDYSDQQFTPSDSEFSFGFALRAHKDFVPLSSEFNEVFDIDPCEVPLKERGRLRRQYEQGKFNVDHYIADFLEDQEINEIISQKSPWSKDSKFTDKELDFLKDLPNKQFSLTENQVNYAHNGLIDILFAFCYERRTNFYEENIESGWTIIKLASTLSWLDVFETPKEALTSAFRRSVIYPLYRNFTLSSKVFEDLKELLNAKKVNVIKCLIEIYHTFLKGDCCRYILNNLFIKDYIIYLMNMEQNTWSNTVQKVLELHFKKEDLGLNLTEIESYTLTDGISNLNITTVTSDSDDTSDESDSDSLSETESDTDNSSCEDEIEQISKV